LKPQRKRKTRVLANNDRFEVLATDNAPGQEVRQTTGNIDGLMRGDKLVGRPVDFSHGDVDAFTPALSVIDRESRGKEALAGAGLELQSLFTYSQIIPESKEGVRPMKLACSIADFRD
jgi:hypothetical protein